MEVMNVGNAHSGVSCFQIQGSCGSVSYSSYSSKPCFSWCGVLNSRGPVFRYSVNKRYKRKMGSLSLRVKALSSRESETGVAGCGIIEEFAFKPSFNEYLKALESIRSSVDKKEANESGGIGSRERSNGKRDGRKPRRSMKIVEQGSVSEFTEDIEIKEKNVVNGKVDWKGRKFMGVDDEWRGRERSEDANTRRKSGGTKTDAQRSRDQSNSTYLESDKFRQGKMEKVQREQEFGLLDDARSFSRSMKGKFANGKEMLERKEQNVESERFSVRADKISGGLVRNDSEVDQSTDKGKMRRNASLIRTNRPSREGVYVDDDLDVERAAFRNFEEVDDAIRKPIVSRREVEERIQKLAKCLNGADIDMPEWLFSKMIRSARIKFTDHTMLRLIQILGKLGNWRRVLQVIEWLQTRERYKSNRLRYVYTTALDVLGRARRPVEALNVFSAMLQQASSYPDLVSYHSIAVTLGQAGHMKELFDVIDTMRSPPKKKFKIGMLGKFDPRLEPDIVVYNAILNACQRRKQWEGAFWVLQQLKEQGIQPSTATYGLIMEVMFACGKYNLVHDFFKKMQKSCIPNALTYRVVVNTLWKEGKTEEAVLAVQEMERRGIVGSAALYYDLARCLCSAGRCKEALKQMEKICKVASKPLVVTYTGLIQACLDCGNIQDAVYIFNEMKQFCCPNLVTCNIMLKALFEKGLFEEAKELFVRMSEGDHSSNKSDCNIRVIPDIYTFNTMLDACVAEKKWDDFRYVYGRMLHHGHHFNAKRHLRMILDASRAGKGEPLEMTWDHLIRADRNPPPPLIKERFCMMLEGGDYISALNCITYNPYGGSKMFSPNAWLKLLKENASRFKKDTVLHLTHEVKMLISRSDSPNLALQDLLASCNDFLSTNFCTVQE